MNLETKIPCTAFCTSAMQGNKPHYEARINEQSTNEYKQWFYSKSVDTSKVQLRDESYCVPDLIVDFTDELQIKKLELFSHLPCKYHTGERYQAIYNKRLDELTYNPCNSSHFVHLSLCLRSDFDELKNGTYEEIIKRLDELNIGYVIVKSKSHMKPKPRSTLPKKYATLPSEIREAENEDDGEIKKGYEVTCVRIHIYFMLPKGVVLLADDDEINQAGDSLELLYGTGETLVTAQKKLIIFLKTKFSDLIIDGFGDACVDPAYSGDKTAKFQIFSGVPWDKTNCEIHIAENSVSVLEYIQDIELPQANTTQPRLKQNGVKTSINVSSKAIPDIAEQGAITDEVIEYYRAKGLGLYKYLPNEMAYILECPNSASHSNGDGRAKYWQVGSPERPQGGFNCFHGGCQCEEKSGRQFMQDNLKKRFSEDSQRIDEIFKAVRESFNPIDFPIEYSEQTNEESRIREYIANGLILPKPIIVSKRPKFIFNVTCTKSLLLAMIKVGQIEVAKNKRTRVEMIQIDGQTESRKSLTSKVKTTLESFGDEYKLEDRQTVDHAIEEVLRERSVDPVWEYLQDRIGGGVWDHKDRLSTFFENYCHQIPHGIFTHDYYKACAEYLFTGIYARANFTAEYKAGRVYDKDEYPTTDMLVVLVSHKTAGIGKTRLCQTLAFNSEMLLANVPRKVIEDSEDHRDLYACAGNSLLCLLDDVFPLTHNLQLKTKQVTSAQFGEYRELYTTNKVQPPRGFMYIATTNERFFLKDDDKGVQRRWACVELEQDFSSAEDMQRIRDDLPQIYLQAKYMYEHNNNQVCYESLETILKSGAIAKYFSYCDDIGDAIEIGVSRAIKLYNQARISSKNPRIFYNFTKEMFNVAPNTANIISVYVCVKDVLSEMQLDYKKLPRQRIFAVMESHGYTAQRNKEGFYEFRINRTGIIQLNGTEHK